MLCRKVLQQIKLVEIDNGSQNLQQVLELILQKVSPAIVTDRRIVQAEMLKRVKLAPVGIPDSQIALVHATNKSVNCPFFSVFQLKKSLKMRAMDQSEISVIRILLMAGPAPMSDFENVLMGSISSSIVMNNHNTQVYANGSLVEIKNLVALQFLNQIKF
nr:PTS sugar transporter subunit IIA [Lactiplantibacillus pentosus]